MNKKFVLRGHDVEDSPLELKIGVPSFASRLLKSFGLLIMMLLFTVVSALIPLLHFVIVPIMIVCTLIVVGLSLAKTQRIESGTGLCPYCTAPFKVFPRRFKLPFNDICESCHRQVVISAVTDKTVGV